MAATYLVERTQNDISPSIYLMGAAVVSALFLVTLVRPQDCRFASDNAGR
jgi:hypothetical protein